MIFEQLNELKVRRKTLLRDSKDTVTFMPSVSAGKSTLLDLIKTDTPYTKPNSINFERHGLSEKEEARFNKKISPFLKSLINCMGNEDIDILLEYLVRVYCIDTYNPVELIYVLLPYRKYFDQVKILSRNTEFLLHTLSSYSEMGIAKVVFKDRRLFYMFSEYFVYYEKLKDFLDGVLNEIIALYKNTQADDISEIYQIIVHLCKGGFEKRAIEVCQSLPSLLCSGDVIDLLKQYVPEDSIFMTTRSTDSVNKPVDCHDGRHYLLNENDLVGYLRRVESSNRVPKEFTPIEYTILQSIYLQKNVIVEKFVDADVLSLYSEIQPKTKLTSFLIGKVPMERFISFMNLEDIILVLNQSEEYYDEMLNENNHKIVLKNMKNSIFRQNYRNILKRCLGFVSFDPHPFDVYIDIEDTPTEVHIKNKLELAMHLNHPIIPDLLAQKRTEGVCLQFYMNSDYEFSVDECLFIIPAVQEQKSPALVSLAARFIVKGPYVSNYASFFVRWAEKNNLLLNCADLIEAAPRIFPFETLFEYLLVSESNNIIDTLMEEKGVDFIVKLYERRAYRILYQVSCKHSIEAVLLKIEGVETFIKQYASLYDDKGPIISFVLKNMSDPSIYQCLGLFYDQLIEYHGYSHWHGARSFIIKEMKQRKQHQRISDYIIENVAAFNDDDTLFRAVLDMRPVITREQIIKLSREGESAAEFVSIALKEELFDVVPTIPFITPLLIKYKKPIVSSLFETYENLVGVYAGNILEDYIPFASLLIKVDPRHSINAIINYVKTRQTFDQITRQLMIEIFNHKTTNSMATISKASSLLSETNLDEELISNLLSFYIRSFGSQYEKKTGLLIACVFDSDEEVFNRLVDSHYANNQSIFSDSLEHAVTAVADGSVKGLYAIHKCMKTPILSPEQSLDLCKKIYTYHHTYSAGAISSVLKADTSVLPDFHAFFLANMDRDPQYSIELLMQLFEDIPDYTQYKQSILPKVLILAEQQSSVTSNMARKLYEMIQFK